MQNSFMFRFCRSTSQSYIVGVKCFECDLALLIKQKDKLLTKIQNSHLDFIGNSIAKYFQIKDEKLTLVTNDGRMF